MSSNLNNYSDHENSLIDGEFYSLFAIIICFKFFIEYLFFVGNNIIKSKEHSKLKKIKSENNLVDKQDTVISKYSPGMLTINTFQGCHRL